MKRGIHGLCQVQAIVCAYEEFGQTWEILIDTRIFKRALRNHDRFFIDGYPYISANMDVLAFK
jgi:hypothetical protein